MGNFTRPNLRKLPDGYILHSTGMDKDDYAAINRHLRAYPLSEEEKRYIDELYYGIISSIDIFSAVLQSTEVDDGLANEIKAYMTQAKLITELDSDFIGRGYSFKIKEVKNEKKET